MKNVVVIGGGHGQSLILRGLKKIKDINISTIVTVADNGGSTGRLKNIYNIPAMGDIRNVMESLAESESLMSSLMSYRFEGYSDVGGHSLGNLILTALTKISGDFSDAIEMLSDVLKIEGKVIPATDQIVDLVALMDNGKRIYGEADIPLEETCIDTVYYEGEVKANENAVKAISEADFIIFSMGSLYTSLIPNLIIPEIKNALEQCDAQIIYFCNAKQQKGETIGYSVQDHINAIESHTFGNIIDKVIVANNEYSDVELNKAQSLSCQVVECDLLKQENNFIMHDSNKIMRVMQDILKEGC